MSTSELQTTEKSPFFAYILDTELIIHTELILVSMPVHLKGLCDTNLKKKLRAVGFQLTLKYLHYFATKPVLLCSFLRLIKRLD